MLEEDTAARAGLGRGGRIDQDHFPTGAFSLVREVSMDPNRYEVSEPELLRGLTLLTG
jgi:hypothetical protein